MQMILLTDNTDINFKDTMATLEHSANEKFENTVIAKSSKAVVDETITKTVENKGENAEKEEASKSLSLSDFVENIENVADEKLTNGELTLRITEVSVTSKTKENDSDAAEVETAAAIAIPENISDEPCEAEVQLDKDNGGNQCLTETSENIDQIDNLANGSGDTNKNNERHIIEEKNNENVDTDIAVTTDADFFLPQELSTELKSTVESAVENPETNEPATKARTSSNAEDDREKEAVSVTENLSGKTKYDSDTNSTTHKEQDLISLDSEDLNNVLTAPKPSEESEDLSEEIKDNSETNVSMSNHKEQDLMSLDSVELSYVLIAPKESKKDVLHGEGDIQRTETEKADRMNKTEEKKVVTDVYNSKICTDSLESVKKPFKPAYNAKSVKLSENLPVGSGLIITDEMAKNQNKTETGDNAVEKDTPETTRDKIEDMIVDESGVIVTDQIAKDENKTETGDNAVIKDTTENKRDKIEDTIVDGSGVIITDQIAKDESKTKTGDNAIKKDTPEITRDKTEDVIIDESGVTITDQISRDKTKSETGDNAVKKDSAETKRDKIEDMIVDGSDAVITDQMAKDESETETGDNAVKKDTDVTTRDKIEDIIVDGSDVTVTDQMAKDESNPETGDNAVKKDTAEITIDKIEDMIVDENDESSSDILVPSSKEILVAEQKEIKGVQDKTDEVVENVKQKVHSPETVLKETDASTEAVLKETEASTELVLKEIAAEVAHQEPVPKDEDKKDSFKLINTLDILSDDEEEHPPKIDIYTSKMSNSDEKQTIDLDDDDDIMLIDDDISPKTEDNVKSAPQINHKDNEQISLDIVNLDSKEPDVSKETMEKKESTPPADVSTKRVPDITETTKLSGNTETPKEVESKPIENKKPVVPENFFKSYKKNLADMTRDDLEEFCILKIVESIIDRSSLSEIKAKLKSMAQSEEEFKKKAVTLTKQNRDLQVVLKSVQEEQKKNTSTPITPLKITRSVGMQVLMTDKNRRKTIAGSSPAPSSNNSNSAGPFKQVKSNKFARPQKPPANIQQIPVPRLVPASNLVKTPSQTNTHSNNKGSPITNGLKVTPPAPKPEKRTHSRMQSVTVDLTDDEPPAKVMAKPVLPPVRLVPSQNLLAARQPQGNSPRKVFIPISGTQSQIRPGQTIMVKNVPPPGARPRHPIQVRAAQNTPRMPRAQSRHPAPLPDAMKQYQPPNWRALPPAPDLKLSKVENGIVISWKIEGYDEGSYEEIASYQLFAYQETTLPPNTNLWKKIGDVKALPLPMACTLTQFMAGYKYYFAVRAVDIRSRLGPFSLPGSILLLNKM